LLLPFAYFHSNLKCCPFTIDARLTTRFYASRLSYRIASLAPRSESARMVVVHFYLASIRITIPIRRRGRDNCTAAALIGPHGFLLASNQPLGLHSAIASLVPCGDVSSVRVSAHCGELVSFRRDSETPRMRRCVVTVGLSSRLLGLLIARTLGCTGGLS
jgi:hypothetical protein